MDEEKLTPRLRFSGYNDAWEQRRLGDYIVPFSEVTTENNQYPVLTSSRKGIFMQTDYYDGHQIASADNTGYNIVPRGFFTYRHMSDDEIFKFNINNLVDFGIVSTLYPVFTTNSELDSKYLQYQLNEGAEFQKYANLQKQGGSRTYMYLSKLKELKLTMPKTVGEQKSISGFFTILDNLITLHQKEYDKFLIMKKAMLDKMFPRKGMNVPEIRFMGFTEPWERRKVGEVTEELDQYTTLKSGFPLLTSSRSGLMMQNEYRDKTSTDNQDTLFSIVPMGACTYRHMSDDDIFHFNINEIVENGLVSREYPVFTASKDNNLFAIIQYLNSSPEFRAFCRKQKMGGTRTRLYYKSLCRFELLLPTEKEQDQIAAVLKHLDNLITLQQRKLEKLKNIKAGCLEKMFV